MTKSELITKIASQFPHLTHYDSALSIQLLLDSMATSLINNDRIEIRGFGSFNINVRASRIGRNPKTGEQVQILAKHVPHYKLGSDLKIRVMSAC